MDVKSNKSYLVKGVIYALILAIGMGFGAILKSIDVSFYIILFVVSFINIIATVLVFYFLRKDLFIKEEEPVPTKKSSKKKSDEKVENKGKND